MSEKENPTAENPEQQVPDATPLDEQPSPDVGADERIAELEKERDEYLYLLKAKQAEFENYQKRQAKERDQERLYAAVPLAKDLLPALDNLERAVAAAEQAGETGPLADGVRAIRTQLLETLARYGVTPIPAEGKPFDPNRHEAVAQQPSADADPGTVLQVYQRGYLAHDRVLRPAMVVVSVAAE